MGSCTRDWAGLPVELLLIVFNNLSSYREYRSFCLVCKSWLSVVRMSEEKEIPWPRPLLLKMAPYFDDQIQLWLWNSNKGQKYRLRLRLRDFKSICGCSHGWFASVNEDTNLILNNPFSNRTIRLPPLQFEFGSVVSKIVLSADPDSALLDCLIAAIFGDQNTLAFTKLGRDSWTYVHSSIAYFNDVMFDRDRLFAINLFGGLISLDPCIDLPYINVANVDVVVSNNMEVSSNAYIVRSCRNGAILMISRRHLGNFQIFKLVEVDNILRWDHIKSLDNETLFVGLNHSLSVSCLALPNMVYEIGPVSLGSGIAPGKRGRPSRHG